MDLNGTGDGEELGRADGGETIEYIYVREKSIFNIRKENT